MAQPEQETAKTEEVISLDILADLSGHTIEQLRAGDAPFLRRLGTSNMKLKGAQAPAPPARGATPQQFIRMLPNLPAHI